MNTIIKSQNVTFSYDHTRFPAVRNLSFEVKEGDFIVLTGPTGSGKTTVLRLIQGLIPHFYTGLFTGHLEIDGVNIQQTNIALNATKVGYVFQDPEIQVIGTTVEKDIAFGLENLAVEPIIMKSAVKEILKTFSIENYSTRTPSTLSGGELRLVSLASVLVMKPKIVVFDEASTYLDAPNVTKLTEILSNLKKQGFTIIYAGHDLTPVVQLADEIWLIEKGQITNKGPPIELLESENTSGSVIIPPLIHCFLKIRNKVRNKEIPIPKEVKEAQNWLIEKSITSKAQNT